MTTANKPKGLTKTEYNALIHAIWRIDQAIAEERQFSEIPSEAKIAKLETERQALSDLFVRIA